MTDSPPVCQDTADCSGPGAPICQRRKARLRDICRPLGLTQLALEPRPLWLSLVCCFPGLLALLET